MHGSLAPIVQQAVASRHARGGAHVWIPRGSGNAGLLFGLVLDGDRWPDAPTFTARLLGCSDDSVRRWTDELVQPGLVERRDGWLVATAPGRDRLRRCDPLPRALLRPGVAGRTPAVLRAAAVLYGETLGMRATRHGVRGDRERADLASVHRETVAKARTLLASVRLSTFAEVRRGRAVLVRAAAVTDAAGRPVGSHGRPLGEAARERVASAAAKRRATPAETGPPIQCSTSTSPIHGAAPSRADGSEIAARFDGFQAAAPEKRGRTASAAELLGSLLPDLPSANADRAATAERRQAQAEADLAALANPARMQALLRMHPQKAAEQLLAAVGVFDQAPRRRAGLAVQAAKLFAVPELLALCADVLLAHPRSPGAVAAPAPAARWSLADPGVRVAGDPASGRAVEARLRTGRNRPA